MWFKASVIITLISYTVYTTRSRDSFNIGKKTIATQMIPLNQLISWLTYITMDPFMVGVWDLISIFEFIYIGLIFKFFLSYSPKKHEDVCPAVKENIIDAQSKHDKMKKDVSITR